MLGYPKGELLRNRPQINVVPPLLFNPLIYTCQLWLRCDALTFFDGACQINQILDKSGNGKHLTGASGIRKSWFLQQEVYRGLSGISYTTDEFYQSSNWTALTGAAARTLFLVYANGSNFDQRAWGYGAAGTLTFFGFEVGTNTQLITTGATTYSLGSRSNDSAPDVLGLRYDGTVLTGFFNSGTAGVTQTVALNTTSGQSFRLNATNGFGLFFECSLITGALTDAQMSAAMLALVAEYRGIR